MIREMTPYDAMYVSLNMRDIDLKELALSEGSDDHEFVMSYSALTAIASQGESWVALNDKPVAVFGVNQTDKENIIWMWGTDDFDSCSKEITLFCRKRVKALSAEIGELKCYSAGFHKQIHRWLEIIGFTKRSEIGAFIEYGVSHA